MIKNENEKTVDIENIIRKKNPKLLRVLPRFLLNYVKKIIHENDINSFIKEHGEKREFEFIDAAINEFGAKVKVYGLENLPQTEGCIIASNHPMGGLDGLTLIREISKKRTDLRFIVNDILLGVENIKRLFIPVNKHGKNTMNMLEEINNQYASNAVTLIFPAGLVSRKQEGVVQDLEWKKSFVTKARQHKKNIIPVFIDGNNSPFFYNLSMWRKRIGVKANIEMLYLVDEMYTQRNKTISIVFGKPIPYESLTIDKRDIVWAKEIKKMVYKIGDDFLKNQK